MWAVGPSDEHEFLDEMGVHYFQLFNDLEVIRSRMKDVGNRTSLFQDEPIDTVISCCRSLLQRENGNDQEHLDVLYVAGILVADFLFSFAGAEVHLDFVDALRAKMKVTTDCQLTLGLSTRFMDYFWYATLFAFPLMLR